ncbi:MAG TPA: Fic family protein [Candidatus Dormibacteraeota bacterium]
MARVIRQHWTSNASAPSRLQQKPCDYEAYIPDTLVGRAIRLEGAVAADVADAESALARFDMKASALVETEALARILLRAEAIASSKIEGLEIGPRRLLRAEAARDFGERPSDITAAEVLGNIDAMAHVIDSVHTGDEITHELLLEIHRRMMVNSRLGAAAGHFRTTQNWIGGSDYNPCSAVFVPPPAEYVHDLITDLLKFANQDSLPAVVQAGLVHSQFESIHPFADGNGRAGRALIHLVLRRRGLSTRIVPPVSLILATWTKDYVEGLTATRYRGPADSRQAYEGMNLWIGRFAAACKRAVADAWSFEERSERLQEAWRAKLGKVRRNSALDLLLKALVGAPIVTVSSAAQRIGRSFVQTNAAVIRLSETGILRQISVGRRNRAFEASDVLAAFTDLERQLASPKGNTRASKPARPVPYRPQRAARQA